MRQSFVLINLPWPDPSLLLRTVRDCKGNNSRACNCKFTSLLLPRVPAMALEIATRIAESIACYHKVQACRIVWLRHIFRLPHKHARRAHGCFLAWTGWARCFARERETRETRENGLLSHVTFRRNALKPLSETIHISCETSRKFKSCLHDNYTAFITTIITI